MTSKKITIIISCYNRIKYISLALESVLRQNYENKNVVVMDDCSNDGSYEKLQALKNKWNFTLLRTDKPQRGTYWISNRIMEMFDTEYFQVLDSDDILLQNATSKLMEFMKKESAEIVGCQFILIDENGDIFNNGSTMCWRPYNANFAYKIQRGQYVNRSGMIWKKQVIDKIGKFNENSICSMNYDFLVRALENGIIIRNAPFQAVKYRIHKDSLSTSHLFGIENKEMIHNNKYFKKKYPFYYRFDENYLNFFKKEFDMAIDEKKNAVENWFAEYVERFNKKIEDKEPYWNKKRIYASRFYQYAVYEYARGKILENKINSVLDIGCGIAHKLNKLITPFCRDVSGIDLKDAIQINKPLFPKINFYINDFEKPSLDLQKKFDLIICSDVIEHLFNPDKLLAYIKRLSHERTIIIISTPERDIINRKGNESAARKKHIREWNEIEFSRYLKSRGFAILENRIVEHCKFSFSLLTLNIFGKIIAKKFDPKHTQLYLCKISNGTNSEFIPFATFCGARPKQNLLHVTKVL